MFVGEHDPFPPLTSAFPCLLFDFTSRIAKSLGLKKDPHRTPQSQFRFSYFIFSVDDVFPFRRRVNDNTLANFARVL